MPIAPVEALGLHHVLGAPLLGHPAELCVPLSTREEFGGRRTLSYAGLPLAQCCSLTVRPRSLRVAAPGLEKLHVHMYRLVYSTLLYSRGGFPAPVLDLSAGQLADCLGT